MPGVDQVPDGDAPVPAFDFHCSFNGLPRAFETTLETIPARRAVSRRRIRRLARQWGERLPAGGALRVGLCWAGQARPWLAGFVGLDRSAQHQPRDAGAARRGPGRALRQSAEGAGRGQGTSPGSMLLDLMDDVRDFADTAAIVANLDLVISVDTSVVHLAGAMGKPVFLLDRYDNCWRWLSGREDSPWYPSLRIFRQQRSGEWAPVIARVATALAAAAGHPSRAPECRDAA